MLSTILFSILSQSRSQSMPVRGLMVGMALAKPNEICNLIGCREINKTDIGINARFLRGLCVDSWIMRNDVNKKNDMESFVNCMHALLHLVSVIF